MLEIIHFYVKYKTHLANTSASISPFLLRKERLRQVEKHQAEQERGQSGGGFTLEASFKMLRAHGGSP